MNINTLIQQLNPKLLAEIESRSFNFHKPVPKPTATFTLVGFPISTPGNITNIIAPAKAGKSSAVAAMIAAMVVSDSNAEHFLNRDDDNIPDTLGFLGTSPRKDSFVVHIDTEQSRHDHDKLVRSALRRAKANSKPDWLKSYCLTGFDAINLRRSLGEIIGNLGPKNIFAILLDGIADFVRDVNDSAECNDFAASLQSTAIECSCPIIVVIHENPGSHNGKGRGHLGSQLERKAESNIRLEKTKSGNTVIFAEKMRGAPISRDIGPKIVWSDDAEMHVSVKASDSNHQTSDNRENKDSNPTLIKPNIEHSKAPEKLKINSEERLRPLAEKAFNGKSSLTYGELLAAFQTLENIGKTSAENRVKKLRELKIVNKDPASGGWKLIPDTYHQIMPATEKTAATSSSETSPQ